MNPLEVLISAEEEKKKCLEQLKKYYYKRGDPNLQKLYDYLNTQLDVTVDEEKIQELLKDVGILIDYLGFAVDA